MAEKDRKDRYRDKCLRVKLTPEELEIAKQKAEYCNTTMSEFIRKIILDGAIVKYERIDIKALSSELNHIGINLNQIAKHINENGGEYDKQDMSNILGEFQNLQSAIYAKVWGIE